MHPYVLLGFVAAYGAAIGSFLNVVVYRLPKRIMEQHAQCVAEARGESFDTKLTNLWALSKCPSCGNMVKPWFNIPVLGWFLTRGRCAHCKNKVSFRYPLIEMVSALLAVQLYLTFGLTLEMAAAAVFVAGLLTLALIDFDTQLLPESITRPLQVFGLLSAWHLHNSELDIYVLGWAGALVGMYLLGKFSSLIARRQAMGWGDAELVAAIGAFVGLKSLIFVMFAGLLVMLPLLVFKRDQQGQAPFGPGLAIGGIVAMLFPEIAADVIGFLYGI